MYRLLKPFEYFEPATVKETIQILSDYGEKAVVLAGGTDLLISMKRRHIIPKYVVSINGISGLDYVKYSQEAGLRLGTLATHSAVADSPMIREKFTPLATACGKVATPQIRNMGTIGGNLCKAGPSQDTPPALMVLDAMLKLVGPNGKRVVPIGEFFVGPFKTVLQQAELLTEIQIPAPLPNSAGCYRWSTKIVTVDETLVGVAVLLSLDSSGRKLGEVRIALCSVAPIPFRAKRAETLLRGQKVDSNLIEKAAEVAAEEIKPRSRADYRKRMTKFLVREALSESWQKLKRLSLKEKE